jgi:cyclic lactone autoinducer peptide
MSKIKLLLSGAIVTFITSIAMLNVSTCCTTITYQPKVPQKLLQ